LRRKIAYFVNVRLRNADAFYDFLPGPAAREDKRRSIVAMVRVRNEELLLEDTLDHLASFADGIVVFDDASTDSSKETALRHPAVLEVISSKHWRKSGRQWEETANRRLLYQRSLRWRPEWVFYADADERFSGDIRRMLLEETPEHVHGIRVSLFDAYLTPDDHEGYRQGQPLWGLRKWFGPERRRILVAWRPSPSVDFTTPDAREPQGIAGDLSDPQSFLCQHYGKGLSIEQWDETCRYYIDRFPIYRDKWQARLGKAIHTESDFGSPLFSWDDVVDHAVDI
jgi:glycosyltransferase involved in cell wall biosynthesis